MWQRSWETPPIEMQVYLSTTTSNVEILFTWSLCDYFKPVWATWLLWFMKSAVKNVASLLSGHGVQCVQCVAMIQWSTAGGKWKRSKSFLNTGIQVHHINKKYEDTHTIRLQEALRAFSDCVGISNGEWICWEPASSAARTAFIPLGRLCKRVLECVSARSSRRAGVKWGSDVCDDETWLTVFIRDQCEGVE